MTNATVLDSLPPNLPDGPIRAFKARGDNRTVFTCLDPEILCVGGAGSGKTRAILEFLHRMCIERPNLRVLICRKARATLASTALATYERDVDPFAQGVKWFGGNDHAPAAYLYPNGSQIIVGGMDDPGKILSSFYDLAYLNEVTELSEEEYETITTRLRNGVIRSMRVISDCNPTFAKHWVNRRALLGKMTRLTTTLKDNPAYYDDDGNPTELGNRYIRTLESLSGSRRERFLLGQWVGVENAIYPHFDRKLHVRPLEPGLRFRTGAIGVDYGRRHKAAAVAISVDQYGRRWVREAWGEPDTEQGKMVYRAVAKLKAKYTIYRGMTDPLQDALAGLLGFQLSKGSAGSRNTRTMITGRLLNVFPGGEVPESSMELMESNYRSAATLGPHACPDSPGLLFVEGAPGIDDLCDEIESYHEVLMENATRSEYTVARIDDDLVAALEYGTECLDSPGINHDAMGALLNRGKNERAGTASKGRTGANRKWR